MSGLDVTTLADAPMIIDAKGMVLLLGPPILAVMGLFLSIFRRCKWVALATAVMSCGMFPAILWWDQGVEKVLRYWEIIFLEWDARDDFEWVIMAILKGPFILGIITLSRVCYLCWETKKQPPGSTNRPSDVTKFSGTA